MMRCRLRRNYRRLASITCALICTIGLCAGDPCSRSHCVLAEDIGSLEVAFVGSLSCASATCHGGAIGRGPMWNQSLTLHQSFDPHAGAGMLLYHEDSRRIVELLDPGATTELAYNTVLRQRCISCHLTITPTDVDSDQLLADDQIAAGVSCESCHGAAGNWLSEHLSTKWSGPLRLEPHTSMRNTEWLVGRAETCVRCHVGSRVSDGLVRDMNHDLIAAGHPALRFDLMTYNDNLPRHWDDRSPAELEFSASKIRQRDSGRRVGLAAAANLASERAVAQVSDPMVPWPELSEYDCFACHQSLKPKIYFLPSSTDKDAWRDVSDGLPMWNAWHARDLIGLDVTRLRRLAPGAAQPAQVARATKALAAVHRTEAVRIAAAPVTDPYRRLAEEIGQLRLVTPPDWHSAAVLYLNLEAAVSDMAANDATAQLAARYHHVLRRQVAPMLRFPSPAGATRWASPRDFDNKTFRVVTLQALDSAEDGIP
jgi:hypothetical protein